MKISDEVKELEDIIESQKAKIEQLQAANLKPGGVLPPAPGREVMPQDLEKGDVIDTTTLSGNYATFTKGSKVEDPSDYDSFTGTIRLIRREPPERPVIFALSIKGVEEGHAPEPLVWNGSQYVNHAWSLYPDSIIDWEPATIVRTADLWSSAT